MPTLPNISPELLKAYQDEISKSSSPATAKRKTISLNKFLDWAEDEGHISQNPLAKIDSTESTNPFTIQAPKKNKISRRTWATVGITTGLVILIFLLLWKLQFPIPFVFTPAQTLNPESKIQTISNSNQEATSSGIPANGAVIGSYNLFAKLKLTDNSGAPQVGQETITFKLFNAATGGSPLYTSDPQSITTDANGSALISLDKVPTDLFFQNNELFLEPEITNGSSSSTTSARIPVETANTAANLNGFYAANPDQGAEPETVPVIDSTGALVLASQSPAIKAKDGNLLLEGQAVTIRAAAGSGGNIEISPDLNGYTHFLFQGNKGNFLNAQAPNLTSGSLYYGVVPNNASGYDFIKLQNGSPSLTTRFEVDSSGNTKIGGDLSTGGTDRLTNVGGLQNITNYSQNSGNFAINQNPGDFATINKTVTSGSALSDVLTLTLDERGKPKTSNSGYSTLVLNRYDGSAQAMALLVNSGNAQFNGLLRLGRYASSPSPIGPAGQEGGNVYYNTTDNQIYFYNGSSWVSLGTAVTTPFSNISSGTNTTAAMIVGSGASLTYSGTGTINATTLNSLSSSQFLRSDTTTNYTSGTLTTNAGTTLNIAGTFQIAGSTVNSTAAELNYLHGSSVTAGGVIYGNGTILANSGAGTSGQILTSGGAGAPTWSNIASSLTAGTDISISGTTNATISDASTLNSVTTRGATTSNAVSVGNLTSTGTTTFGGLTYTWPASQTASYVLSTNGAGTLSWIDPTTAIASSIYWTQSSGAVYPKNNSVDLLVGASSTASAKFAFTGVASGTPTASISGTTANVATYLTGNGNLATTNMAHLTIGGSSTGGVDFTSPITSGTWNGSVVAANYGGTGFSSYAVGDMLYANSTSTLAKLADVATGNVLKSGGVGVAPSWGKVILGTDTTGNYVSSITGTTNEITASTATGDVTLSIPSDFRAPGTVNAVNGVYTGATAGTQRIDSSGNLTNIGTTQFNGLTYTWPASQTANYVLQTNGAGTLSWVDPNSAVASTIYWAQSGGAVYPKNNSVDLLVGASSTASAKFAFTGVASGTPTASISGTTANVATFIDGNGNISSTNRNNLILGNSATYNSTGNILLNPNGTGNVSVGTTAVSSKLNIADSTIDTGNVINATSSGVTSGNILNIGEGGTLPFAGNVLQADIQNGGGASFTGNFLNFLNAGSLKFKVDYTGSIAAAGSAAINGGSITTTAAAANVFNSATTLNLGTSSTAVNIGAGTGTTTVNNNISVSGTTTFGGLTYTWPGSQTNGYVLSTNGSGTLSWSDPNALVAATQYWNQASGALFPKNNSVDILIGASSTSSAKFAFTGVTSGTPTASISGTTANVAVYLTGNGNLATTNMSNLTIGGSSTGNVILSPSNNAAGGFVAPNTNNVTDLGTSTVAFRNIYGETISTGGTGRIDSTGNLTNIGTTQFNGLTYTWPASQTANYILQTNGAGTLSWVDPNTVAASTIYWTQASGALFPKNNSVDVLIGANSTNSAKFAFTGVNGGLPTASIAGNIANVATYMTGDGNLATTNMQDLTLGGSSTGQVILNSRGNAALTANGANLTTTGTFTLPNSNTLTGVANFVQLNNGLEVGGGSTYYFDKTGNINANNITGAIVNATTSVNTGAGAGTARIDASGNLTNIGTTQLNGITYTWPGSQSANYVLQTNGSGTLSWVDPNSAVASTIYWTQALGAVFPKNNSVDLLVGSNSTSSAKFAITGVNGGLPTATIAGNIANVATYVTGDGNLATTNMSNLTIGGSSTGNVVVNSRGSTALTANGANITASGIAYFANGTTYYIDASGNSNLNAGTFASTVTLPNTNTLTGLANFVQLNNGLEVGGGSTYYFDKTGNINANNITGAIVNATTSVNTGAGAGTARIDASGNLTNIGTTQIHGVTYTWPAADGSSGYALTTNGSGTLSWSPASGLGTNYWNLATGALYPQNNTVDLLIGATSGSTATQSAKFAFTGVNSGLPTASIAGDIANVATYLTGDGNLATTNARDLTLGGTSTGNVVINSRGSAALTVNGANLTTIGTFTLPNTNTLTGLANFVQLNNGLEVGGGSTYYFDKTGNINANTIATGATQRMDASGNLTNIGTTQINGLTYTWPASQTTNYILQTNGTGTLSWVDPNTVAASTIYWAQSSGAVYPKNNSVDLLVGANSTASAKFAVTGVNGGLPTATIAGNIANVATYLTGNGNLATTNTANLSLGGISTGNIILSPSNDTAGGYIAPKVNAVTDLGTSSIAFRNIFGGTIDATTSVNTGAGAGTARIDASGNLTNIGTTQLHGVTYTWPAADAAVSGYVLSSNGAGALSWVANGAGATGQWTLDGTNGVLYPNSQTADVLMGGTATISAKFAFKGIDGGLPTASISGNVANVATFIDGNGNISSTNRNNLILGNSATYNSTGNILLNPNGTGNVGIGTTNPATNLHLSAANATTFRISGTNNNSNATIQLLENNDANGVSLTYDGAPIGVSNGRFNIGDFGGNTIATFDRTGNVGIGTTSPTALLDVVGSASISGTLAFRAGTGTIQTTAFNPLTIGGSTTGNITLNPSNAVAGGYVAPNTTNVTDLGTSTLLYRNVYATNFYQGAANNSVCDASGNCNGTAGGTKWKLASGAISPFSDTLDVLIGNSATASAKFAFTGVDGGTPTASVAGTVANVAMFIDGNGNISSTNRNNLTLGNSATYNSTGNILLNPNGTGNVGIGKTLPLFTLDVNGSASVSGTLSLAPMVQGTAGTCNASAAGKEYYDGVANQYYFCNGSAWTAIGSGSGTNFWQLNNKILSPANSTYDLAIGGTATGSAFQVFGSETPTSGLEALNSTVTTTGNVLSATASALTTGNILKLALGGTTTFSGNALQAEVDTYGGGSFTGNFLKFGNNTTTVATVDASGDISGAGALQIGSGTHSVAYSRFGTAADNGHFGTPLSQDVLFSGRTEFIGNMYLDNGTTGAFTISDYQGTGAIIFPSDPKAGFHTLGAGSWKVDNTQNVGQAAFVVNQSSTINDLFDASASGTIQFKIANNGDTTVGNAGLGKITVGTVDPPYTINGSKYATFLPGITGVKEETTGTIATNEYVPGKGYRSVIDFNSPTVGSDLWVFSKATDIKNNIGSLVALLTPSDNTRTWYEVDHTNNKVAIYSSQPTSISYRLTAPRFDAVDHPNTRTDGATGFVLNIPDVVNNNAIATTIQNLSNYVFTKISDGAYIVKDNSGVVIDGIESIGNFVAANIKAGAIQTQEIASSSFSSFQGTVDNLLIASKLVTPTAQVKLISPLANESDINIQIGNTATSSGKLAIKNAQNNEVASIDNQGNATFSGVIHSQNIDSIQALLNQVQVDQSVLLAATSGATLNATNSANLSNLITSDLYVTNQAAINSLSVSSNLAVGSDLIIGSGSSLNTLSSPLRLQSLAMAPIELMAGLVKIDTHGNVQIAGNLAVAGRIKTTGLTLGTNLSTINDQLSATTSAIFEVKDATGSATTASIDASGSATFSSLQTQGLTIAGAYEASSSALVNGVATTNSTVGSLTIPANTTEITIKNPKVTDYTLVYVTPTSSTQNNVLYIKSKQAGQFVVGFDHAVPQDVSFNWWIVQVSQ